MTNDRVDVDVLYANEVVRERETIEQISLGNNIQGQALGLWYYNKTFAIHALKKKDLESVKQYFYRCGRIDEFLIKKYDSRLLDVGMANVSYTLLSDDLSLIAHYADLGHSKYDWMVEHGYSTIVCAFQQSIKEDWEKVQNCLDIMANKNQKLNKVLLPDRIFLEKLIKKDKQGMEEALYLLLKDHKKRNKHMGVAQDYISIPALGYSKLAWLKGIEVEIDHPLIPKELLPYRPLAHYDAKYEFLKERI